MKIDKRHLLNYSILLPYLALSIIGLIIVYSTTSANLIQDGVSPFSLVRNQSLFLVLSLVAITFIYRLKLNFLKNGPLLRFALFVEMILLIAARFFPRVNGAYGWISLGPITFQPAEYLKFLMVWYLAYSFAKEQKSIEVYDYQALTKGYLLPRSFVDWRFISAGLIGLVVAMPDLGNATIILLTVILMYSVSGIGYKWFSAVLTTLTAFSAAILGFIGIVGVQTIERIPIFGYIASRFSAFFDPFQDAQGAGLQLANSYYAMSNGGWFGRGLGNSIEKKGYLPEAHTDFVFSIVIEELGLIGAGLILALVFFLILRILLVGIKSKNAFNSILALGVGGLLLTQVFVNVGGVSGLIPSTGVTFPFLSQGGNSLLVLSVAIGLVLNIDANEKREEIYREIEESYEDVDETYYDEDYYH
ncbi:cell division peptidoglycan polymerase FtsW [Streptococcus sp. CSL10205-OR2]|uniref:cell division peptidoglycan polymerase FtsW n=1 Tax=Streptococcus sp. CSL10205-OR2 TaxID=2980558 RepID=UPI0021D7F662|nr:FtsW/RodA/SpoVE family cell cycle protein [Streptococcus sp. CSL10205-OR2]MCU9534305.1 FtsW/RodA/SpoVE family cell cycle protein [Streptococcus sp. CSL10205-OR2]